jgi:hypothetical protein
MNLLCPNCQKMLSVPEEYAGQLMQCPLCRGTFQMPAVPQAAGAAAAPTPPPPPPPPPVSAGAPPTDPFQFQAPPPNIYSVAAEPPPFEPPPAPPRKKKAAPSDEEFIQPVDIHDKAPPPGVPGEYRHAIPIWISPRYLQWIVPGALFLVFLLSFFPWERFSPGGVSIISQNAWQAAFGSYSIDEDIKKEKAGPLEKDPGGNVPLAFFLILMCIALLLAGGAFALNFLTHNLPPPVRMVRGWRWLIVGAVVGVAFLFLLLQVLIGFSLEARVLEPFDKRIEAARKEKATRAQIKMAQVARGGVADSFHRTFWFRLAFWLTLLAAVGGLLEFWTTRRGARPLPKLEFAW